MEDAKCTRQNLQLSKISSKVLVSLPLPEFPKNEIK